MAARRAQLGKTLGEYIQLFRNHWLVALLLVLLGAVPAWLPYVGAFLRPRFRATTGAVILGDGLYHLIWSRRGLEVNREFRTVVYFTVTNTSGEPREIEGYAVEAKQSGAWRSIGPFVMMEPDGFGIATEAGLAIQDLSDRGFDRVAAGRTIAPGETVGGWIFIRDSISGQSQLRLRIFDNLGKQSTIPFALTASPGHEPSSLRAGELRTERVVQVRNGIVAGTEREGP